MLWGERVRRRRALIGTLVAFALIDGGLGVAFFAADPGPAARAPFAPPLHPVAGSFVPNETRLEECADERCFQQAFGNVAYREGPTKAFALLGTIYGDGAGTSCHRAVHLIGAASLARNQGNVVTTLAQGASTCGSGYYHGVLERSLLGVRVRTATTLGRAAKKLCGSALSTVTPWVAFNCLHGVGHGLMIATGLRLPLSLASCRRLSTWWERDACRGGVFMENIQSSYGFRSRWIRDDDPIYPCNAVRVGDKKRCYQMVTSRILPLVGDDWERAASKCSRVQPGFVSWCFWSFGRDASSRSARDPQKTAEICAIAGPYDGERQCLVGAAREMVANFNDTARATELCELVEPEVRSDCYFGIGSVLGLFSRREVARSRACLALASESALARACVRGGRSALPRSVHVLDRAE